jgi:hypothetical protein
MPSMNGIVDELILSAPIAIVLAIIYFVYRWKPRQSDPKTAARTENIFWSAVLTVVLIIVVYYKFFRP